MRTSYLDRASYMTAISSILSRLHDALQQCYSDRLVQLVLYGSHARGEATSESDIDVMVVLKSPVDPVPEIEQMGDILTDLLLEHNALVSVYPISENDFQARQSPLLAIVREEGVFV